MFNFSRYSQNQGGILSSMNPLTMMALMQSRSMTQPNAISDMRGVLSNQQSRFVPSKQPAVSGNNQTMDSQTGNIPNNEAELFKRLLPLMQAQMKMKNSPELANGMVNPLPNPAALQRSFPNTMPNLDFLNNLGISGGLGGLPGILSGFFGN